MLDNIAVSVDGYQDNGLILECIADPTDTTIRLAETSVIQSGSITKPGTIEENNKGDLSIKLTSFKLYVSNTYVNKGTLGDITFSVTFNGAALPTYTSQKYSTETVDIFGRNPGELSYITFPATISKTAYQAATDTNTSINGWTVYDLSKVDGFHDGNNNPVLKFSYGSLFGNLASPATFYNKKINYDSKQPLSGQTKVMEQWSAAAKELGAMSTAFGSNGKIKITTTIVTTQNA